MIKSVHARHGKKNILTQTYIVISQSQAMELNTAQRFKVEVKQVRLHLMLKIMLKLEQLQIAWSKIIKNNVTYMQ